jgi:pantetheine-phosphate adenylyltransferase
MVKAVYPGSFDPVTLGHLDIIRRAAKVVDELIIGVLVNSSKKPFFTLEERVQMIREVTKDLPNVRVVQFEGMTVQFARDNGAHLIIRGLRAVTDFEYEMQIAQTNHSIAHDIDTMFFTTSLEYAFLSSTIVKEVAYYGGDINGFVMPEVIDAFNRKHEALGLPKLEKHS